MKKVVLLTLFAALVLSGSATRAGADGGTVSRVSVGPLGGSGPEDAKYVGPWGDNDSAVWDYDYVHSTNGWFLRTPVAEGPNAYFTTKETLAPADTDGGGRDLYRNDGTSTELITTGPGTAGPPHDYCGTFSLLGACPFESSRDTTQAFFSFEEPLVPEDTDGGHNDVYRRFAGATELFTTGPAAGNGPFDVCTGFEWPCSFWVSADGSRLVFETREKLVPGDYDFDCAVNYLGVCEDLYERANGVTRLLTTGPLRTGSSGIRLYPTSFFPYPVSADARHVFFQTDTALVADDSDRAIDVYESFDGTTRLVSTGPFYSNLPVDADFRGASADGTRSYFAVDAPLTTDSPHGRGLYERADGVTRRLPLGPPNDPFDTSDVSLYGPSFDGSHVLFATTQRLTAADTDNRRDLYAYSSEHGAQLVSTGPAGGNGAYDVCTQDGPWPCLEGASRDGTKVYFTTEEPLVAGDTDNQCPRFVGVPHPCEDIYVRDLDRGTTELVSTGPGPSDGAAFDPLSLDSISADGGRAFFRTKMALVPQDTDGGSVDLYERFAGRTRLISTGPLATNARTDATFGGSTADGRVVFFETAEGLVQGDGDGKIDVYRVDVNEPPDCSGVTASRTVLTTVNRRLVPIALDGVTDVDGDPTTIAIDGVTQDEPVTGRGDPTSPDAIDEGDGELRVRAERNPHGDGRVYRIAFTATDGHGGSCSGTATVSVPRKRHKPAVDSAPPSYDSFGR